MDCNDNYTGQDEGGVKTMKYKVYFEIYGKKMQTETSAGSDEEAMENIANKIIFHKIERVGGDEALNNLKSIFGWH
jgi:hypothetical protein